MYKVGLAAINVPEQSKLNLTDVMLSGDIGQASHYIEAFEREICRFTNSEFAIVTCSGTMADAVAIGALKQKYNPRRVIVPALTFVAQPNSVLYNNLDVEFVDVDEHFLFNWEQALTRYDNRTSLYFPSDCLGRISDSLRSRDQIVEDACESFGSEIYGQKAGNFGELGTFSFFISHTITTGEGGAIITNDEWLAGICRSLRSHGRASDQDPMYKFSFPHVGFNAKMSAPQAAIGCGVMQHAQEYIVRRHENYVLMNLALGGFEERNTEYLVPHAFPVEFVNEMSRNDAMRNLLNLGIECRKFFSCIPTMEGAYRFLRQPLGSYPVAEHIAHSYLYVPCHQNMTIDDVTYVVNAVKQQSGRIKKEQRESDTSFERHNDVPQNEYTLSMV